MDKDNYLIDRETLEKFVDELTKNKPAPVNSADELYNWREQKIQELDNQIGLAIFDGLSEDQLNELNVMLDDDNASPDTFQNFFQNAGIDVESKITEVMRTVATDYLGGQNE